MQETPHQKNIVHGTIQDNGNVHIGDIIYNISSDFQSGSILFLRLDHAEGNKYVANLSVKSKHSTKGGLARSGEKWCENIELNIPPQLFDDLAKFQAFRRSIDAHTRYRGPDKPNNNTVRAMENKLSEQIFQTFFSGDIGKACKDFIQLLEERRLEELLLVISTDDENITNLPFEMVLPLLFPPKLAEAKKSLAINNFGLVRTKMTSPEAFNMQGKHAAAAPLKMLFITALPENLDERGKMLQIEEEQTRLIQSIGALEATGDNQPKIVIEFLENASLVELDNALRSRQHDIVHISGHGAYRAAENKGVLYFENEDGDEEKITGKELGETLREHACVKLLILSACETAIAGSEGGVTEQAAAFGIPSIVAMRFAVTDEGAKVFTTEFYTQLAKGLSITRALAYAREALHNDIVQRREHAPQILHIAEWFTPVVYQNQAISSLIDKSQPYHLPDNFYPRSSFLKTRNSRLIGEGFIGRKRYRIQMRHAFRAGRHVCLYGLGGLGKTTLAEAFAHNYDNRSHKTIIFRNGSQINEAHILETLNNGFAEINPNLAKQIQQSIDDPQTDVLTKFQLLIDNYLKGRKTIIIFDNVEDVQKDEEGAFQRSIVSKTLSSFLRHLCENTPSDCHILLTTRYKIEDLADVVEHLNLDKMGYAEQYRLLNYSQTLRGIPLQDRDKVYERLDGHPRGYEYLEALLKKDKTFNWQQVSKAETDVFENLLLAKVYERLTESEKAVFQVASVFITRTSLAALEAFNEENESDILPILKSLQEWSLCFLESDGHFEVHRLTREWMRRNVIPTEKVKEWALKAGEFFEEQPTWGDEVLAKHYFEIAEAWQQFADSSFRLQDHYQLIGLYQQALELNQAILEKNVEEKSISIALFNMGAIFRLFGQNDKALELYEASLVIDKKIGNRQGQGASLNNIGNIHTIRGEYDIALRYLEQSLEIAQEIGDRVNEGTYLNNISQIHRVKGDYSTALRYLEQSLEIAQEIDDRQGEGVTLNNISQIYNTKGDHDNSLRYLEQSLDILKEIGDRQGEGVILNNISQIYDAQSDFDTALKYLEQSLAIRQEIGDRKGEGTTLNNISQIYVVKGDYETALQYLEQSLIILQEIGNRKNEGGSLNNISQIYVVKGDYETALQYLEQSLAIRQEIGDRQGEATTLNNIGHIYDAKGDYDTALKCLELSLAILQNIGDRQGEGTTLNNISQIFKVKGDFDTALKYLEQSLAIRQEIGDRQGESVTLNNISSILYENGKVDEAMSYSYLDLQICQEIGDINGMATTMNNMGARFFEQGHLEEAIPLLVQAYQILHKIGSPDVKGAKNYLSAIIEEIGEEKFQEIISKMEENSESP